MEQIFMFEVFVKKIVLELQPYVKDAWELEQEEIERQKELARLAALEELQKGKKGKKKPKPTKKPKKGKGKKEPPGPSEEEIKFMKSCTVQMNCLPIFDFYIAHENFVAPPPPPPPPKNKKGKGKAKPKPKKSKKGKKAKVKPFKLPLPSDPLPQPPYVGVGNIIVFVSRATTLIDNLRQTPVYITVWNREENFNCIGYCTADWPEVFFETLKEAGDVNPVDMDQGFLRNTDKTEMVQTTVEFTRPLQCEDGLQSAGEVEFAIRLTCLGNKVLSSFIQLPEMDRLPGRKYLTDEKKLKDFEVIRHWEGTKIEDSIPVSWFYQAPDILREPVVPVEVKRVYSDYVAPFTKSELAILSMGFPKGPCGGFNCPKRMEFRGSQHQFIHGEYVKGKYQHGHFVNKRDVHGPCGRLDCPLAKKVRAYLCNEGAYKTCKKPCPKDYY